MDSLEKKLATSFDALTERFGYTNRLASPRLIKVVVSAGVGRAAKEKGRVDFIAERLARITGQKPAPRAAKKAIAAYKSRIGDTVGLQVTMRGARMRGFLEKLLNAALPRTRDFRGVRRSAVDGMGNLTIGIPEHTIFPETADEELRDVFGCAVTVVSSAKTRAEAEAFFAHLGVPFAKK
jgi:large subunit ribosomal protein L5